MAKVICIRKYQDVIELKLHNEVIANIVIAKSSRTSSVNLSIESPSKVKINRVSVK